MQPKFKKGDLVKCITGKAPFLVEGEIYEVVESYHHDGDDMVYLNGQLYAFYANRFELSEHRMTLEEQAIQGLQWIRKKTPLWDVDMNGEKTLNGVGKINQCEDSRILLVESRADCQTGICLEFFRKYGAHVAMSGDGFKVPIPLLFELPQQLETKLNDYDVVVSLDNLKVGCQTISWEKFDEINALREKLRSET